MKKILSAIIILSILICYSVSAKTLAVENNKLLASFNGTVYYVDSENGKDDNSGTSENSAWQTLKKINSSSFKPGDAILLKKGSIFNYQHLWLKSSGDENNPITVSSYGDGELPQILSVNDPEFADDPEIPNVDSTVYCENLSNVTIDGLYLRNLTPSTGDQYSIYATTNGSNVCKNITIRNCTVYGSSEDYWQTTSHKKLAGITINASLDGILIENNEVYNCKDNGITVNGYSAGCNYNGVPNMNAGKNVLVKNNYLYNIGCDGILVNNCYMPVVEYNVVNTSHTYSRAAEVAIWPFACYGALLQYNEAFNTQTAYDGQGFDCDYQCYNTTFQYNYSHDNTGGFMLICNENTNWNGGYSFNKGSVIRYNISENDIMYTFSLIGNIEDTKIYNNTIYSRWGLNINGNTVFTYSKGTNTLTGKKYADNIDFINNLIVANNMSRFDWQGITNINWKNNLYYGASNYAPSNNKINNSADAGKYVCSVCKKCFALEEFVLVDEANSKYTCPDCGQSCTISQVVVSNITSSENIFYKDPLIVNPGEAGNGIKNCEVYKLYSNSPCIGTGLAVDESTMLYKSKTDFYGNPITSSVNIGAYQGNGVGEKPASELLDNRYIMIADFEKANYNSKDNYIQNLFSVYNASATVTEDKELIGTQYDSTKGVKITNNNSSSREANLIVFLGYGQFENSNGISFWVNGMEKNLSGKIIINNYKKSFTVPANGGYVSFRWTDTYMNNSTGKSEKMTKDFFSNLSRIQIYATLDSGASMCADDFMADTLSDTDIVSTTPSTSIHTTEPTSDEIKAYPVESGQRVRKIIESFNDFNGIEHCSYLKSSTGNNAYNKNSFYCTKSTDTYDYNDGTAGRYNGIPITGLSQTTADYLRFWYKSSGSVILQLRNTSYGVPNKDYTVNLPANTLGGWYTIKFTDIINSGKSLSNLNYFYVKSGSVYIDEIHTIKNVVSGDANGDGTANMKDLLLMKKYKAGISSQIDLYLADTNNDGKFDLNDMLLFSKYLSNMEVKLY